MARTITLNVVVNSAGAVAGSAQVTAAISQMSNSSTSFLQRMSSSFESLSNFISKAASSFSSFMSQLVGIEALKSFLDKLIDINTNYNQFVATLTAVKRSSGAARDEFDWLMDTANRMGVNIETTTKNYATLAASMAHVDKSGESTRAVFEGVSAAASVLHQKGYQTNGVLLAFEQIISKNKLSLEEVQRQLANRLPDAMGMSARAMGMSSTQFRDAIKNDMINPLEFVLRMSNEMKKMYGDAAKDTADSFIGQTARMNNAIYTLYKAIGQSGAMDGLTTVVKALTDMFADSQAGKAFGESLKVIFEEVAGWIRQIDNNDVHSFFDGLAVDIHLVVDMLKGMVTGFGDLDAKKPDVLDFTEFVGNAIIVLAETIHTLIAGIMAIPNAFRNAKAGIDIAARDLNPYGGWTDNLANPLAGRLAYKEETDRMRKEKEDGPGKDLDANMDIFMGRNKPFDKAKENFAKNMKAARDSQKLRVDQLIVPPGLDQFLGKGGPLSEEQIKALSSENDHTPKGKKGPKDPFLTEQLALMKAIGTANLEYNNILNGLDKSENKNLMTIETKLKYDQKLVGMSAEKANTLRDLARQADAAELKEKGAEAFQKDKLDLDKKIGDAERQITEVLSQQDPILTKNVRAFEEKLANDAKYKTFSADMIQIERDKAKALDNLTVRLQNVTKLEAARFAAQANAAQAERNMNNANKGYGPLKYLEEQKAKDSLLPGGSNSTMDAAESAQLLKYAKQNDKSALKNDESTMGYSIGKELEERQLNIDTMGMESDAYNRMMDIKKIVDTYKQSGIDLTKAENAASLEYAQTLANNITQGYAKSLSAQRNWVNGVKTATAAYLDGTRDVAGNMDKVAGNVFKGMEDAFTSLLTGGKFDFTSFATSIVSQLMRIMVQITIMEPLIKSLRESMNFGGSGGGSGNGILGLLGMAAKAYMGGGADIELGEGVGVYNENLTEADLNFSAKGNAFTNGAMNFFANGGAFSNSIASQPTIAPMAVFGEAGSEAIMPLGRNSSGELGVKTDGGGTKQNGGIHINYAPNIQIDARTDRAQVNEIVQGAVQRGHAELVDQLQRSGAIA